MFSFRSFSRAPSLLLAGVFAAVAAHSPASAAGVTNPANGHTYHVSEDYTTWSAAEAWAVSLGGHLLSINDAGEDAWLHANLPVGPGHFWIGGRDPVEGSFEWVTGEPFFYQNFLPGEPDDDAGLGGNGDCLALSVGVWAWMDTNGDFVGFVNGAIAEVPATTAVSPAAGASSGLRLDARPSVTAGETRLCFALDRAAEIRCAIFDTSGRRMRTLGDGLQPSSRGELAWDGRDESGGPVPAGLYVVLLEAGGRRASCKVLVTR